MPHPDDIWHIGFRRRARQTRHAQGLSSPDVAGRDSGRLNALARLENGDRQRLGIGDALMIAHACGMSWKHLLDGWRGEDEGAPLPKSSKPPGGSGALEMATWATHVWSTIVRTNIRRRMAAAELSQNGLARQTGLPQTKIAKMLTGRQAIDLNDLRRIATALGCRYMATLFDPQEGSGCLQNEPGRPSRS